jgi:hypothetical protein
MKWPRQGCCLLTTVVWLASFCRVLPRPIDATVPTRCGVETQLRDVAILLIIALLFVLTLQLLRLTRPNTDERQQR